MGGDIDEGNLRFARERYSGRQNIEIRHLDAHRLPFEDSSFDVVILYEAIYYLKEPEEFIREARRILRKEGVLLVCTVNKDWLDFNPSPFSLKYFSVPELNVLLKEHFGRVELLGAFKTKDDTFKGKIVSFIKRCAVFLHLMPKTMKGKELLKRIFFGKLRELPAEVEAGMAEYQPPAAIPPDRPNGDHKVIYAVARVP